MWQHFFNSNQIKNGFFVNGNKYVRLLAGAGNVRVNTVVFCKEDTREELLEVLENGRRKNLEIVPAKFNAYFALSSSATLPVSTPYFCVVPDYEVVRKEKVEYVQEIEFGEDLITEQEMDIMFNLFDGQGLISPRQAEKWSIELGLDYIPSTFIIRSNFINTRL